MDAEATPKTLDLLFSEGPHAGKVSLAIYKLVGHIFVRRRGSTTRRSETEPR